MDFDSLPLLAPHKLCYNPFTLTTSWILVNIEICNLMWTTLTGWNWPKLKSALGLKAKPQVISENPCSPSMDTDFSLRGLSTVNSGFQSWQPPLASCQTLPGLFLSSVRLCEARHAHFSATDSASASTQTQKTASLGFQVNRRVPFKAVFIYTAWPLKGNLRALSSTSDLERMFLSESDSVPPFKIKS